AASKLKEEIKKTADDEKTSLTPYADTIRKMYLKSTEPTLTEKELDKPGEVNPIKKIERIDIKIKLEERRKNREEKKITELKKKLKSFQQEAFSIVEQ